MLRTHFTQSVLLCVLLSLAGIAPTLSAAPIRKAKASRTSLKAPSVRKNNRQQKKIASSKKSVLSKKAINKSRKKVLPQAPEKSISRPVHAFSSVQHTTETPKERQLSEEVSATPHPHKAQQEQLRTLRATIGNLVNEVDKKASVGVKVVLLKNNSTIYEKNADHLFTPASNTKLITAAAAYHLLGPDYRFTTTLYTDKKIGQHTINNLYIKGVGDPTLTAEDLQGLAKQLRKIGIYEIKGSLIVDASLFASEKAAAPGWSVGDGPIFDKAPTGALMVEHSCIRIQVKPARVVGKRPHVIITPHADAIRIQNDAKTTAESHRHSLTILHGANNTLIVRGTLGKRSKTKFYRIAVEQPDLYAGQVLAGALKAHAIHLRGTIKLGLLPENPRVLCEHTSEPLNDIIRHLMKKSDNLYADALFRLMGALHTKESGSWASGRLAIENFLKTTVGLDMEHIHLFDGSGLSHKNKITPNHFIQLLSWVYTQSPHKDNFIASLPIGGVDGSLRNRMKQTVPHAVKAKTGNLNGVTCLSGYITPKTGLPLIFVIMVNRKNKSAVIFKRKLEDQLCKILAAHAFSTS